MTNDYISSCNRSYDKLCPIFQVGDMLAEAEPDDKKRKDMQLKGAVLQLKITWNCDYSPHIRTKCLPIYKISRFDEYPQLGFNFRYANKYLDNLTTYRDYIKAFGLRIIVQTTGKAFMPDIIGILVAFLALCTILSISYNIIDCFIIHGWFFYDSENEEAKKLKRHLNKSFQDELTEQEEEQNDQREGEEREEQEQNDQREGEEREQREDTINITYI